MGTSALDALLERLRPPAHPRAAQVWLGAFSRDVLGRNLDLLFRQTRGLKADASIETIHDARVTARRLSEYLELAQPLVPQPLGLAGREFLDAFTRVLSPIRNADVPCEFLRETLGKDPPASESAAARFLEERLLKRRKRKLKAALDFWRRGQTANRLADLARLRRGLARSGAALKARFPVLLAEHLERRAGKVRADASHLALAASSPQARDLDRVLHAFRREVRLLRYGADAARGACGRPRPADIRRLRAVQQVLGEHHDLAVLLRRVVQAKEGLSGKEPDAAALLRGLDRLAKRYQTRQAVCLRRFRRLLGGRAS